MDLDKFLEPSSYTIYRIPKKLHHCHFSTFEFHSTKLKGEIVSTLRKVENQESPKLLLLGPPGRGKSHLAVAAYRWFVYKHEISYAFYLHMPTFCGEVKSNFDNDDNIWEDFERARVIILDDLFARDLTQWEMENVVFKAIDTIHNRDQALVLTANQDTEELTARLRKHEMSRLLQDATVLDFSGLRDRRLG